MSTSVVEIKASAAKLLLIVGLGVLMTAAAALLIWPPFACRRCGVVSSIIGVVGAGFFGLCILVGLWRLVTGAGRTIVTITPESIRDTRIAAEFVPWRDIEAVSTWAYAGQKVVVLRIPDAVWDRLTLTPAAAWSRGANRALGADGLAVTAQGLQTSHEALLALCTQRLAEAHSARRA